MVTEVGIVTWVCCSDNISVWETLTLSKANYSSLNYKKEIELKEKMVCRCYWWNRIHFPLLWWHGYEKNHSLADISHNMLLLLSPVFMFLWFCFQMLRNFSTVTFIHCFFGVCHLSWHFSAGIILPVFSWGFLLSTHGFILFPPWSPHAYFSCFFLPLTYFFYQYPMYSYVFLVFLHTLASCPLRNL